MAALFGNLFAGTPPTAISARGATLAPCPDTPNCVSSKASDDEHRIAPIAYTGTSTDAMAKLARIVGAEAGATIVTRRDDYLYATFQTPVMGFVDDVEFALVAERSVLDVRSASRLGRSDFGVNRRRLEKLRAAFEAAR